MACTSLLRLLLLLLLELLPLLGAPSLTHSKQTGTIAFATVGRARFAFDIYTLSLPPPSPPSSIHGLLETRLTNGESVNYNGHFVPASHQQSIPTSFNLSGEILAFVSESQGRAQIYLSIFSSSPHRSTQPPGSYGARQTVELQLDPNGEEARQPFMRDRPVIAGGCAIYVSTQQASGKPRKSWAAVYSTELRTRITQRLTPQGVADYSPAVSPSGEWTIVASDQRRGWQGEVHELHTDLYLLKTSDGSQRTLLLQHGGWPSWGDDSTFFFHREEHGWWGVFRATISQSLLRGKALNSGDEVVRVERVTPLGLHAFTPAASPMGDWVAVATRRPESDYRHIELFDLKSQTFVELTRRINPRRHHYNPFVSSDSKHVGYHRCRGMEEEEEQQQQQQQSVPTVTNLRSLSSSEKGRSLLERGARQALIKSSPIIPHLEHIQSPLPQLSLLRLDGTFPSFSPDGSLIAFIPDLDNDGGVYVMRLDGSGRRKIFSGLAFGTAWDWKREGVVYTSYGPNFATQKTTVHIVSIFNAHKIAAGENIPLESKVLTKAGSNNAFPSASPDGKHLVFRSGRSGYKNLYIMDAVQGEEGGLRRLTEGPWTDTMCSWSPDGEWIAFASDRDNPGGGSFVVYFIHPNGTGLHKVLNSGIAGRVNHPSFSPDSRSLVFTTDYAGISAEPVSVPHQYQPYGEIFIARLDGSGLQRLTHNSYEDGTPSWGRKFISQLALSTEGERDACSFRDDTWLDIKGNYVHGVAC